MKYFILLFLSWCLFIQASSICPRSCGDVSCYQSTDDTSRLTSIDGGDYNIQALGTFTEEKCHNVTENGIAQYFALKYGLKKINDNFTKFGKIGLQVDNICRDLPTTMARGIEIISLHRPNSVCRSDFLLCKLENKASSPSNEKKALAVVGTGMSFTTIPLASLMSLYKIPQVSYSASSRLLSKNNLYKSFFRTIPSDSNQVKVIVDLFKRFRWNYVIAIGSDDDYGKLGITDLKRDLTLVNDICITKDEYVPYKSKYTQERVNAVVNTIEKEPRAKVVILFLFVKDLGDLILKRAQEKNISRVWITSEAWNPSALALPASLSDQAHGIISVSLKSNKLTLFHNYVMSELSNRPECNLWLKLYMKQKYNCMPTSFDGTSKTYIGKNCTVPFATVSKQFQDLTGRYENIIDAVTAIGHAIGRVGDSLCPGQVNCTKSLESSKITENMYKVQFTNEQNKRVEFDENGDVKYAEYTVDNLRFENGRYHFVQIGTWSSRKEKGKQLTLDMNKIQWPLWFKEKHPSDFPSSNCTDLCEPGKYITAQQGCCWHCAKCERNFFTDRYGESRCRECPQFYHANENNNGCIETQQEWMKASDSAGIIIIIISSIGLIIGIPCCIIILRYWKLAIIGDEYPHVTFISLIVIVLMFAYGAVHVFKPSTLTCRLQNIFFFNNLIIMSSALMLRSKFVTKVIQQYAEEYFRNNLRLTQMLFFALCLVAEIVSSIVWVFYDNLRTSKELIDGEIRLMCEVKFSAARLIATFLPCVLLIIATSCAFRERNLEHIFYERKFLSFACIAECIVMLAFLPTFKYVSNVYRSIVLVFTHDVYAFTFMTCMILPRVYVTVVRKMKGKDAFKLKPATIKRKKPKKRRNELGEVIEDEEERPRFTSAGEATETSVVDNGVVPDGTGNHDVVDESKEKKGEKDDDEKIHFSDETKTQDVPCQNGVGEIHVTFNDDKMDVGHDRVDGSHVNDGVYSDNEDALPDNSVPSENSKNFNTNL